MTSATSEMRWSPQTRTPPRVAGSLTYSRVQRSPSGIRAWHSIRSPSVVRSPPGIRSPAIDGLAVEEPTPVVSLGVTLAGQAATVQFLGDQAAQPLIKHPHRDRVEDP